MHCFAILSNGYTVLPRPELLSSAPTMTNPSDFLLTDPLFSSCRYRGILVLWYLEVLSSNLTLVEDIVSSQPLWSSISWWELRQMSVHLIDLLWGIPSESHVFKQAFVTSPRLWSQGAESDLNSVDELLNDGQKQNSSLLSVGTRWWWITTPLPTIKASRTPTIYPVYQFLTLFGIKAVLSWSPQLFSDLWYVGYA